MATVVLNFGHQLNTSLQIGDMVYYVETQPFPGQTPGQNGNWASTTTPHVTGERENIRLIGPVILIQDNIINCDMDDSLAAQYGPPGERDFIMFSKDNKVNLSSLLGYYCLTTLKNNSTEPSELFAFSADFVESSK